MHSIWRQEFVFQGVILKFFIIHVKISKKLHEEIMLKRIFVFLFLLFPLFSLANPPLPANKAFKINVTKFDPNTINLKWKIAKGYFLYKNCLQIINKDEEVIQLGMINYPNPQTKTNRQGQLIPVYYDKLDINIPILSEQPGESFLEIRYQGCSDEGFCYPPEHRIIKVAFSPNREVKDVVVDYTENLDTAKDLKKIPQKIESEVMTDFAQLFASKNLALIVFTFLGLGLLLAFTPCILPMVPVLSGIIVGHGANITTRKAFFLSLTYVLSMSVTYGLIGAVIALLGSNLQIIMQSPWIIVSMSAIFVLLALSMFNLYAITLPLNLQNKLANITKSHAGGHFLNAAILGSMSILVLSPCVSAPLIGALSYIAQTGDIALGLISLFFLSFGMGIPLLLIGTSAGKLLPKAGGWMNTVKHLFGIVMLGISIYLLSRIIPNIHAMLLWAALCIFSGIFFKPFRNSSSNQDKFKQGLAIILIGYGLLILYGASSGHTNPLKPLQKNQQNLADDKSIIVKTLSEAQNAMNFAKDKNTPVLLYFYAGWCASCHVISSTILRDETILRQLEDILLIKVDLTKNNEETKILLNHFHVIAPPTFMFVDKNGNFLPTSQLVGEISTQTLLNELKTTH